MSKTKAFAYYRTSSSTNVDAGEDDSKRKDDPKRKKKDEVERQRKDSLARQKDAVEAYASANGIEIAAEFYDAAVKGSDAVDERPDFQKMLTAIAGNGVRKILVETANRFARDLIVQETGYRFLQKRGIELIAVDSPGMFLDDTPTAVLVRQILGAVAQFEKAALVAKLAGARKRLGKPGGKPAMEITHPAVIERVRQLRDSDPAMTLRAISAALADEGHVTPTGKTYNPAQIARILARGPKELPNGANEQENSRSLRENS
jgi:DNA invertase Pin-like site-specific DNA recombinase